MNRSHSLFCQLYRPIGALLLLLAILLLLLRSCNQPAPVVAVPTATVLPAALVPTATLVIAAPTATPTAVPATATPTTVPPTPVSIAPPKLNLPTAAEFTSDGLKLSGTGEPGATVEIWDGTTLLGTAVVGADGTWSMLGKMAEGPHKLTVRTVDAAGKTLNESDIIEVTVPKSIALPTLNLPEVADFTPDGVKLSGTGEPGATVEIWDGTTLVGTAVVGADGTWSLSGKLAEGAHKLTVRTVDAAGKTLNESDIIEVTVPKAIALPTLNLPAAADFTPDGVRLSGTGEPGATVEIWDGTTLVGTAVVGADGTWSLLGKLTEGAHKLTIRTVDAAGKTLNESDAVEVTVPEAPADDLTASGQAYIVKPNDWLVKLSRAFYGEPDLYMRIFEGTNAKAAVDPTFATITDPNLIEVGWKLWIPAAPGG